MSAAAAETPSRLPLPRILHDPLPGTGYRALRRLGGGATSEVYEAVGRDGARRAVKVLRALFADTPDAVFRLEQEGRALASLRHPNLAPVLDAGTTAAGRPYFTMPLLEGLTVKDRLARGRRMAPAEACAIVAEVLDALDTAHHAGLVHRDVKPGNVFLTTTTTTTAAEGGGRRCVLLDFGVAKIVASPGRLTTDAAIMGTPRYLAPEQILGGAVDARTDVYAAGLTLFEMIAGRSPFDAEGSIDWMRAHVEDAPRRLRELAPVTGELERAVARAIAKAPARRWASARAFATALARAGEREPVAARADEAAIQAVAVGASP